MPTHFFSTRRIRQAAATRVADARGFTLIESLIATCIVAVLTSAGLPSLKGFVAARAADARIDDFRTDLRFARSEALKRQDEVTLCARAVQRADAAPACAAAGRDWGQGWIVFVDGGVRGVVDGSDQVLKIRADSQAPGQALGTQRNVVFQATGFSLKGNLSLNFSPADEPGAKVVCVNKQGKSRVRAAASCGG